MKDEILSELRQKMTKSAEALEKEFKRIRTGRASTALLEGIKVECYDTQMPLEQVASMSVPESRLMTIQPWDQSIIGDIEKGILKSELGLTPINDGKIIRISIPPSLRRCSASRGRSSSGPTPTTSTGWPRSSAFPSSA